MDFIALAQQFDAPTVKAIVLMGSYARGEAGPYSDVDLVRFVEEADADLAGVGSHLLAGVLVVVSNVTPSQVERWFSEPKDATDSIVGLRVAQALIDRDNTFAAIGRTLIQDLLRKMPPTKAHGFRSVVGHYIAGTAGASELSQALDDLA